MKIALVTAPLSTVKVYGKFSSLSPSLPPLGLCYLAAVLLNKGYEVKIIDCFSEHLSHEQLIQEICKYSPDVVGVSSNTISYPSAKEIIKKIKRFNKNIITILGGTHISALPKQTLQECEFLDIGVIGEGENTLLEIIQCIDKDKPWIEARGIAFRQENKEVINPYREPVQNLDELPSPALHLLKNIRAYSHTPLKSYGFTLPMITSRGCSFNCSYCDQSVFGRRWRAHSANRVFSEMKNLARKYGVTFLSFEDDNFLLLKERVIEICDRIMVESLKIKWACSGRIEDLDKQDISLMYKAGCQNIYVGIETGSHKVLELLNKEIDIEKIKGKIRLIRSLGIRVYASFMIGLPTETKDDIQKTISLALSLPIDGASFFRYVPFPNTKLRDLSHKHGWVSDDWEDYAAFSGSVSYIPHGLSREYLLEISENVYKRFFLRPTYILRHISNRRFLKEGFSFLKKSIFNSGVV